MGYSTEFEGQFAFSTPLTAEQVDSLLKFAEERHEGNQFPSRYCQWVPTEDGRGLEWDQNEKFYTYVEWLEYLIEHFFNPIGVTLSGVVRYQGDEIGDTGTIKLIDSALTCS